MQPIQNIEGLVGIHPKLKRVGFEKRGFINLAFEDGRILFAPIALYPSIKKMNGRQRAKYHITGDQVIIWDNCDEVFHIEQFLGREVDYGYRFVK